MVPRHITAALVGQNSHWRIVTSSPDSSRHHSRVLLNWKLLDIPQRKTLTDMIMSLAINRVTGQEMPISYQDCHHLFFFFILIPQHQELAAVTWQQGNTEILKLLSNRFVFYFKNNIRFPDLFKIMPRYLTSSKKLPLQKKLFNMDIPVPSPPHTNTILHYYYGTALGHYWPYPKEV